MTETALAIFGSDTNALPAHLQEAMERDRALGNENVSAEDQAVPRISLLQALSPQIDDVEGARPGQFHISTTNELVDSLMVINLAFRKEWAVFKDKDLGGGFNGSYESEAAARAHVDTLPGNASDYQIIETAKHALLVLDEEGNPAYPAEMFFKSSALNQSRKWNSEISIKNGNAPRFATVWKLSPLKRKNDRGTWYVPQTEFLGYAPEALYNEAKALYTAIAPK